MEMKKIIILVIMFIVLIFAYLNMSKQTKNAVTKEDAKDKQVTKGEVVVDIREQSEIISSGILKGALWIPTSEIRNNSSKWTDFLAKNGKTKKINLYCASGGRASGVLSMLTDQGYQASNLGGYSQLKSQGFATVKKCAKGTGLVDCN